ncbi:MAG: ABC transporter permease subunit [Devosia sp.]|nr:ABC transporter permease subunit [Devosia sp.]
MLERLAVTLPLALLAFLISVATGLGLAAADAAVPMRAPAALLAAMPAFWAGLLLILGVAGGLKLLPASGFVPWQSNPAAALGSLLLPALAIGIPGGGQFARLLLREADAGAPGAIQRLRSAGMTAALARRRLAMTRLRSTLPALLGQVFVAVWIGSVLVETLFYLPGLGRLTLGAALQHDLPLFAVALFTLLALALLGDTLLRLSQMLLQRRLREAA